MRLSRVEIRNHSRLADAEIVVRDHLVLVGPNDVGKSSLLRCLDFLLGASTAQLYNRITSDDFRDTALPFVVAADLTDLDAKDQAHFPDEPSVDPATSNVTLTLQLEATIDFNGTVVIDRRAPFGNTGRQLSRAQLDALGWKLLGATAMARDLREDRRSPLDDILQSVDLGDEQGTFDSIVADFQAALTSSPTLDKLRTHLSGQLSKALPVGVSKDELSLESGPSAEGDVLADVRLRVTRDGTTKDISEQSDGLRALYALALYDLVSVGSNMVAVDEPEIHLHPASQRSLSRLLQAGPNQKFLATHSPDVVSAFPTDCIVAVRSGGVLVQPDADFLTADEKLVVRWWVRDKLEPLTARHVIAVEGISDRIIVEKVADLTGQNLDRLGVSVIQTNGSEDMPAVVKLFGQSGFKIAYSLLIDEDARATTAGELGVPADEVERHGAVVSAPDLEAEYVTALGAAATWQALASSGLFKQGSLANCGQSGENGTRTEADVRAFCANKKYKVHAAMAVAEALDATSAGKVVSVVTALARATLL